MTNTARVHWITWSGLIVAGILSLAGFVYLGTIRSIASDEGFYALASQRIGTGHIPYLDFFYPQGPLLPYVYGAFFALVAPSWKLARLFTACIASLSALGIFSIIAIKLPHRYAFLAVLLFFFSGLTICWFPTVKIFSLTSCFLVLSLLAAAHAHESKVRMLWILSGVLLGFACGVRSYVVVCILPYALFFSRASLLSTAPYFIAGFCMGLLPHAALFALDVDKYIYNNLGYHLERSTLADEDRLTQKLITLGRLFGWLNDRETPGIQYGLLFLLSTLSTFRFRKSLPPFVLVSFGIGIMIFLISLLPTPTWQQYFSLTTPFFILPIVFALRSWQQAKAVLPTILLSIWAVSHILTGAGEIYAHANGSKRLPGPEKKMLLPKDADLLSKRIQEHVPAQSIVLSLWPGHIFGTHFEPVKGMENQFWVRIPRSIDETKRQRYHVMSKKSLHDALKAGTIPYVLSGRRNRYTPNKLLENHGYSVIYQDKTYDIDIWKLQ